MVTVVSGWTSRAAVFVRIGSSAGSGAVPGAGTLRFLSMCPRSRGWWFGLSTLRDWFNGCWFHGRCWCIGGVLGLADRTVELWCGFRESLGLDQLGVKGIG